MAFKLGNLLGLSRPPLSHNAYELNVCAAVCLRLTGCAESPEHFWKKKKKKALLHLLTFFSLFPQGIDEFKELRYDIQSKTQRKKNTTYCTVPTLSLCAVATLRVVGAMWTEVNSSTEKNLFFCCCCGGFSLAGSLRCVALYTFTAAA